MIRRLDPLVTDRGLPSGGREGNLLANGQHSVLAGRSGRARPSDPARPCAGGRSNAAVPRFLGAWVRERLVHSGVRIPLGAYGRVECGLNVQSDPSKFTLAGLRSLRRVRELGSGRYIGPEKGSDGRVGGGAGCVSYAAGFPGVVVACRSEESPPPATAVSPCAVGGSRPVGATACFGLRYPEGYPCKSRAGARLVTGGWRVTSPLLA